MMMRCLAVMLLAAACGGSGNSTVDAAVDAPPDVPEIDAPMDGLATYRFVVSALRVPANNNQAREYGLDLDNDLVVDNQMGMVLGTLAGQGFDAQPAVTSAIDKGTILMLPEVRADSLTQSIQPATIALFEGANPTPAACAGTADTTCRKHLAGNASFMIAADSAHDAPLTGTIVSGQLIAGPGHVRLIANLFGDAPLELDLVGARMKLDPVTATGIAKGSIGGGITTAEMDAKIYPAFQASAMAAVTKDCTGSGPDCGCAPGSTGRTWISLLDTAPMNCAISVEEVKNNTLFQSLFAPDVTLEGQPAISIGLQITGVGAKFLQ
jgi:hypothetical protein